MTSQRLHRLHTPPAAGTRQPNVEVHALSRRPEADSLQTDFSGGVSPSSRVILTEPRPLLQGAQSRCGRDRDSAGRGGFSPAAPAPEIDDQLDPPSPARRSRLPRPRRPGPGQAPVPPPPRAPRAAVEPHRSGRVSSGRAGWTLLTLPGGLPGAALPSRPPSGRPRELLPLPRR